MHELPRHPPTGQWTIRCRVCGRVAIVETKDVGTYLKDGFPTCCGRTTLLTIEPIKRPAF
jgi:hypothetical protein